MTLTIAGANSSVGLNLLAHVRARAGQRAVAVVRSVRAASAVPESSQITVRVVPYSDVEELAQAMDDASCVVHLAGILIETRASRYESANVATTSSVVAAALRAGADHIVLVSVLRADPDSENRYLASKGEAERIVAESGIATTILRTPILLGHHTAGADSLLRAAKAGRTMLIDGGRCVLRPLDLDDLSRAILAACDARPEGVSVHELVGPEAVLHRDLVARTAEMMGRKASIGSLPSWLAKAAAAVKSRLSGGGITPTVIDVITADEVLESDADAELGIELTPLATTLEKVVAANEATR